MKMEKKLTQLLGENKKLGGVYPPDCIIKSQKEIVKREQRSGV